MIVIDIDGEVTEAKYSGDTKQITDAIGCRFFDIVQLTDDISMFVDDEGLLKDNPVMYANWKAVYLRLMSWMRDPKRIHWGVARLHLPPYIIGNVVILGANGPDTVDLNDAQRELVLEWLGEDVTTDK